jgi:hypothetical protein
MTGSGRLLAKRRAATGTKTRRPGSATFSSPASLWAARCQQTLGQVHVVTRMWLQVVACESGSGSVLRSVPQLLPSATGEELDGVSCPERTTCLNPHRDPTTHASTTHASLSHHPHQPQRSPLIVYTATAAFCLRPSVAPALPFAKQRSSMGGKVQLVHSPEDWQKHLSNSRSFGGKAMVVDFTASWLVLAYGSHRLALSQSWVARHLP